MFYTDRNRWATLGHFCCNLLITKKISLSASMLRNATTWYILFKSWHLLQDFANQTSVSYSWRVVKKWFNEIQKIKRTFLENFTFVPCKCLTKVISSWSVKHLIAVENFTWMLIKANFCCKQHQKLVSYYKSIFFLKM